ncbi:hypothetical protein AAZX31_14G107700 [Glycine max]
MSWLIFSFVPNSLNSITHAPPIYIIHLHFLHPHPKPNKIKDKTILTSISRVTNYLEINRERNGHYSYKKG